MQEIKIFENADFGTVRTVEMNEKVYFIANDVAKCLGYKKPADAITVHCKGSVKYRYLTAGGCQDVKVIPEGDVYRLIIRSKLPQAEKFESWVFDEVLPSIRQTGDSDYYGSEKHRVKRKPKNQSGRYLQSERRKTYSAYKNGNISKRVGRMCKRNA